MKKEFRNVVDVIVKNDLCIGCGLCAGVCPVQVLRMDFNEMGEFEAVEFKPGCLPTCNVCLEVCPFWDRNKNEDDLGKALFEEDPDIQHTSDTGFYLDAFAGYANSEHREQGASGGIATWLLETLLNKKIVDRVICVGSNPDPNQLFKFTVCSTAQQVRNASRSCYYPVELSEMIRYILANESTYALTGLPCYIKGMRLAMELYPKLRQRVIIMCGLVCDQTQSKHFLEQLVLMKGGDPASITNATFRLKDSTRPANDYGFHFESNNGDIRTGDIFFKEGYGELWLNRYFTPNACHHCDDVFAETADVTFMDAWLPEYQKDPKGHNIILVRSPIVMDILNEGMLTHELNLTHVNIQSVKQSQTGGIMRKRKLLALRMEREGKSDRLVYLPKKRVSSVSGLQIEEKLIFFIREKLRTKYRARYKKNHSYSPYDKELYLYRLVIFLITKLSFFSKTIRALLKNNLSQ
jgi:coenzyme F420 hydrogenase subunit beta